MRMLACLYGIGSGVNSASFANIREPSDKCRNPKSERDENIQNINGNDDKTLVFISRVRIYYGFVANSQKIIVTVRILVYNKIV